MKGPRYFVGKGKNKIVLAKYCSECQGYGYFTIDDNPKGRMCDNCDGMGIVTTKDGAQVLSFIGDIMMAGRKTKA